MKFKTNKTHSLGVELELQLVDEETATLSNAYAELAKDFPVELRGQLKPELMQSYLEINTRICATVAEVEADLRHKYALVHQAARRRGLSFIWAGTHPFSSWRDQKMTPDERYRSLVDLMQDVARRLITFGMHVHVGIDSGDKAIMIIDRLYRHLPLFLALSANSPFWEGRLTGLHSYRIKIMESLPTAGLPPVMRNWSEYVWLVKHLQETGFIHTVREIWWDVRPHDGFGTIEVRVMDMPYSLDHALALTALIQSLVAAISEDIDRGAYQNDCHPMVAGQNKWRACRFGLDAQLVDPDTWKTKPVREIASHLVDILQDHAQQLKCENYLQGILQILHERNGAEHQLDAHHEFHSSRAVARHLAQPHVPGVP